MGTDRYLLGIDFGTSNTVAMLADPFGRTRPLLFDASPLLSSAVLTTPGGDLLVGVDAERAAATDPGAFEPNPKRRVDDGTVWLGEREVPVVDLIAAVLRRVADEARRVAGRAPDEVVLTHPASWGPQVRLGVLAAAATAAGLHGVRFVPEPVAAATYFATVAGHRLSPGQCLVVYDLGAGTFDATVLRPDGPGFRILTTGGLDDVGGLDIDAAVIAHARAATAGSADAWRRLGWPQTKTDQHARHLLWRDARAVKEHLSRHPTADLHVALADVHIHVTRDELEPLARPHLERTVELTLSVLAEAGVAREQVGAVYLVGGSSRMPLVATLLHRGLRIAPAALDHPELVVAEGALHAPSRDAAPAAAAPASAPVSAPSVPSAPPATSPAAPVSSPPAAAPVMSDVSPAPPEPVGATPPARPTPESAPPAPSAPIRTGASRLVRSRARWAVLAGLVAVLVTAAIVVHPWTADSRDGSGARGQSPGVQVSPGAPESRGAVSNGLLDASGTIFSDNFGATGLGASWHPVTGDWYVVNGVLTGVQGTSHGWQTIRLGMDVPADITVHFRVSMSADGVAELMLHVSGNRFVRAYLYGEADLLVLGDGSLDGAGAADSGPGVHEENYSIEGNTWYDVTVTAVGPRYTIAIGGQVRLDWTDSTGKLSRTGGLGFTALDATVLIDDLTVRKPQGVG